MKSLTDETIKIIENLKLPEFKQPLLLSQFGCDASSSPSFSSDIYIADRADRAANSHSFLGATYRHAQYAKGSSEARSFLAGSQNFKLDEIEVYKRETKF